jgi:citrate synthase
MINKRLGCFFQLQALSCSQHLPTRSTYGVIMSDKTVDIQFDDKHCLAPVQKASLGSDAFDIAAVKADVNLYTYNDGLGATASCKSAITFIDGGKGELLYRGYAIEELANKVSFTTVIYLLCHGELPTDEQHDKLKKALSEQAALPNSVINAVKALPADAHPMSMILTAVGALSGQEFNPFDPFDKDMREAAAVSLMAKMPTLCALAYRHSNGLDMIEPDANLSYIENFANMLFGEADATIARALDAIFTLHADHEQNASTTAVRTAGSTGTHPFAAVCAGIGALWGAAHGGANEAALKMLQEIGSPDNIETYLAKAKDKNDPFRLMGFGHRVYKNYDPRAKVMQSICHDILAHTGAVDNELFQLAVQLEKLAREDDYFIQRNLYPNVDFYSGITQSAIGLPANMFTVIFSCARSIGWLAQWMEMMDDPKRKITRPRQVYIGEKERALP